MILRKETAADVEVITEVTTAAFKNHPISNHTEQFIINALRDADALIISLVAEIDGRVVGHIAFSPVIISDGTKDGYGLGPVSVLPDYQKQGIGRMLMEEAERLLREFGCPKLQLQVRTSNQGVIDFYHKIGYKQDDVVNLGKRLISDE